MIEKTVCGACGSDLAPEGSRFCPSCGSALEVPENEIPVATALPIVVQEAEPSTVTYDEPTSSAPSPKTQTQTVPETITTTSVSSSSPPSAAKNTPSREGANFFVHPTADMLERAPAYGASGGILFSANNMRGKFTMPQEITAGNILGATRIDASRADFVHAVTTIHAGTILGSLTVVIPAGVRVAAKGLGVLGQFSGPKQRHASVSAQDPAPLIVLNGASILGSVCVKVNEACPPLTIVS